MAIIIERTNKKEYTATGSGLVATGRSHYEAFCRLLKEVAEMAQLYRDAGLSSSLITDIKINHA